MSILRVLLPRSALGNLFFFSFLFCYLCLCFIFAASQAQRSALKKTLNLPQTFASCLHFFVAAALFLLLQLHRHFLRKSNERIKFNCKFMRMCCSAMRSSPLCCCVKFDKNYNESQCGGSTGNNKQHKQCGSTGNCKHLQPW